MNITIPNKNIARIALATGLLLMIPLLAMRFTDEVSWGVADFVVAGALLFGTGLTYELVARKGGSAAYRGALGVALGAALLLAWVNGAVGLIGSENNPANLLYGGVFAVGVLGAIITRFRPRGMARTLFATAVVQALVPVMALVIWKPGTTSADGFWGMAGMVRVFEANAFFVALFLISATLFRRAASAQGSPPKADA